MKAYKIFAFRIDFIYTNLDYDEYNDNQRVLLNCKVCAHKTDYGTFQELDGHGDEGIYYRCEFCKSHECAAKDDYGCDMMVRNGSEYCQSCQLINECNKNNPKPYGIFGFELGDFSTCSDCKKYHKQLKTAHY